MWVKFNRSNYLLISITVETFNNDLKDEQHLTFFIILSNSCTILVANSLHTLSKELVREVLLCPSVVINKSIAYGEFNKLRFT